MVVAPVRAVLQPVAKGLGDLRPVALKAGDEAPLEQVVEDLVAAAYGRTDLVERRGEFAVRGGILDVFPPTEDHPLRVEFWGDTVEEIRWFKVADQRSLEVAEHGLWAPPCREVLLTETVRERARALMDQLPGAVDLLGKLAEGIAVEGMESLAPALVDGMESVLDTLRDGTAVVVCDPERVRTRAHDLVATTQEFLEAGWANAAAGNAVPIDLQGILGTASFWSLADLRAHARDSGMPWWDLSPFVADEELADDDAAVVNTGLEEAPRYRGSTPDAVADLQRWVTDGWRVVVVTEGPGLARRVAEVLAGESVPARLDADLTDLSDGVVHLATGSVGSGFLSAASRFALLTETDLTGTPGQGGSTKDMRRMPSRRRNQVDPLQLKPGDFVVHEQHGVGKFVEMMQRTVGGATREYLVIEYAASKRGQPGDRLFVPTDQLDQVTRYVGGEQPTVNRMGGSDWQKTKGRARKYVKQIAAELIQLYSARMATQGHAFSPDTPWQRELEDAFAYVETPDQLSSIDEVKADMERTVPMDRLICGDVGYGKTEIAVRAAFKAIQDGKQVAVLVPTTLLVQQHFQTFTERYAQFPVTVRAAVALPERQGGARDAGRPRRRQRRPRHRHAPPAQRRDPLQGPRAGRHRRGAALRRRAQGAAQDPAHRGRRAGHVGHPDPAHAGDGRDRHPRDVDAGHAARGAPPGPHLRGRLRREADRGGDPARAAARRPGVPRPQQGVEHRERPPPASASWCPRPGWPPPTARWASTSWSRSSSTSGTRSSTCWSARRSSRPAWTSPTPTP